RRGGDLSGGTGIEPLPKALREYFVPQSRGCGKRAVAAEKRQSIASRGFEAIARIRERDPAGKFLIVRVPGEERSGLGVGFGHHVKLLVGPWRSQPPFVIGEHAQTAD